MKEKRSLIGVIQFYMCFLLSSLVLVLGSLWLNQEIKHSRIQEEQIRETYMKEQKKVIKVEVDHVVDFIGQKREQLERRVRKDVQMRTEEAYQTALYIFEQNRDDKNLVEIGRLIHDSLYGVTWNNGQGYYFAEDMSGVEIINRNNPELEGKNIINLQDGHGNFIMQDILAVARSEKKEGFCTYYWNKPGSPGQLIPKISYVKYFEPLDWVIGTGTYLSDEEKRIKQEVLARIEEISFDDSRYIFAGTWEGQIFSGPGRGQNMGTVSDIYGVKIVQELIARAKDGGGFVNYVMPKFKDQIPKPKISYSAPVQEWQWYIGTGIYIDEIETEIVNQQARFRESVQKIIIQVTLVLALSLLVSFLLIWVFARKIKRNFDLFLEFFKKSASEKLIIPKEKVSFTEFQSLALSANKMTEERQQVWVDLLAEQERLAVTLRSIGDGVITTDIDGRVVFINKIAEKISGWSSEDARGKYSSEVFDIINEKTGEKCDDPVLRVLKYGKIIGLNNDTALRAKNGTVRSIADSGAPIKNHDNEIIGVVLVFRDVTSKKKMEKQLLNVEKLESVGILAGGIAHDFNNILSAILGNIELAGYRIEEKDSKAFSLLVNARKATRRAAKLTEQLLTFSKGGDPVKEEISLPELITESADFVLHGSKVVCAYEFFEPIWMVDIDSGQIGQVIQNIIINAKQSMPDGGTVTIQCLNILDAAKEQFLNIDYGDYVRVTVSDNGTGIPKDIIDKVFDPYFTTKQQGSGLGLAICHSIINKHKGYLNIDSSTGKGTNFTMYLPALRSAESRDTYKPETTVTGKAIKIMVMDDEEMIRDIAGALLEAMGNEVVLVADGEQALVKYRELQDSGLPVDLVIMDLTIPGGMGGQEAAEKLLVLDPEAKIIVASGYSNDQVMADYKEYGFRAAIAKPFDFTELNLVITAALKD